MAARGLYGQASVGNPIYHTVADRADAVRRMDSWVTSLVTELGQQLTITLPDGKRASLPDLSNILPEKLHPGAGAAMQKALANDPKLGLRWAWYLTVMRPVLADWHAFRRDQIGADSTVTPDYLDFAKRWETDWGTYEQWHDRWASIGDQAAKVYALKHTPPLDSLPTTVWSDVGDLGREGLHKLGEGWTLAKVAVIGGLALGGTIALASVVNSLRTKTDPMTPYLRFAKR